MTLPASGYLLLGADGGASGRSINSEFGYGNDFASYVGVFAGRNWLSYQFPKSGNTFAIDLFYQTYKITSGSQSFSSTQSYVIPVYNTITITCVGGTGGQAGFYGYNACGNYPTPSTGGSSGDPTSFGGYVLAGGGAGGGGSGGSGSSGSTVSQTFTNPAQGGTGPLSGSSLTVSIGAGGSGGQGGSNFVKIGSTCYPSGNASSGSAGSNGSVLISWS